MKGLRPLYAKRCRMKRLQLFNMNHVTAAEREAIVARVSRTLAALQETRRPVHMADSTAQPLAKYAAWRRAGGQMSDVFKLVQFFKHLDHFPHYSRVRKLFFTGEPPASTVVEVSAMLPTADILVEVEATAYVPLKRPLNPTSHREEGRATCCTVTARPNATWPT